MHQTAQNIVEALEADGWTGIIVPGADLSFTKTKLGETYDIYFMFRLTPDHRFDAPGTAKQLLEWAKSHRPGHFVALLAVVFDGAHVIDIEHIAPVSEVGWYHRVVAGLIDLQTSTYYGFSGYEWLLEKTGLQAGRR